MAETCGTCGHPHPPSDGALATMCILSQKTAMRHLLALVAGDPVPCRGCQAPIYWVTHKNGKRTPYTPSGLNHFIDCPAAAQFGKGRA